MEKIEGFLDRFRKLTPPAILIRESFSRIYKGLFKKELNIKDISFNKKNGIVTFGGSNIQKSNVFIKREFFIEEINKELKNNLVKDIR